MQLDAFRGAWRIDREIEDVRAGARGRFEGVARFEARAPGLHYEEEGQLEFEGRRFRATRRYLWREGGAGTIELLFPDGRFFHRFRADEPRPAAVHDCGADRYRVRYDFRGWPRWRAEWRVTGPAKDYGLASVYRPAGQAAEKPA